MPVTICVDFDGTIADHCYPDIGNLIPGAVVWLRKFHVMGHKTILHTMRSDDGPDGLVLSQALKFCNDNGIHLDHVNENPSQKEWTSSPKIYGHYYVDDAAVGCPLKVNPRMGGKPFVDWHKAGPMLLDMIVDRHREEKGAVSWELGANIHPRCTTN